MLARQSGHRLIGWGKLSPEPESLRCLRLWFGCRMLRTGELFVMNPAAPDSFDGRYFGTLRVADVIGRATPVWTDEAGDGRHVWFASPRATDIPVQPQGD